ncbi:hypothetical protein ACD575_01655 [Campylobacter sp. LH-2024]|uniref:Uncharacterized protein n=1 Tax=Campylobacter molothri TaxID=1032242 RepID=A0ACC5W1I6_9BACT|nr:MULTISPECIES: hypothetical protein [unclassified Campylobacter]MBZ7928206.1 hypothetical protein [Campylobacter sp. RM10542]MBZ7929975.1 hypothetical protein [Campylobacter sp. W0067]MBZ7930997.1 hypothetical protein [Campylobacter sp. RM12910]MBZ7932503.1 hypothetical protein [Campylobacter sp. RM10543]MBZ7934038.1 hypothetical protein [Campylobacter sp. W0065]MBZ7937550.1 hypothetical protein [Campylobacter sp. RM10538]MBZ7940396.1 hypothetical protein [Campylobacter sp. W0047]MBZ79433
MLEIYLLIAALSFLFLYFAVKKIVLNVDNKILLEPIKMDIYPEFCEVINDKIRAFKEHNLKNQNNREQFLEKLSDLSRELTFIQTMNLSNKNNNIWENELFEFLKKLENILIHFLENGEEEAENLRESLMQEFQRLKSEQND